ncbi:DDE superfamily endonuclease [Candidatus Rhabdochlamydia oedothoracis]|uniref:DDE superfamily endonuclease n=1 Tax=Candidatus Rhabdochlamydia oedothoracis TaxID=2720720 RepID=A0ABX8UYY5_9BACT|nr:hypothetical protein RHOW815_000350 [Candidatus Rhabdochlamydia sp. W815]QYF48178.1 DDE superfamily endonuclease [Candidatus Rhabdochlamydia oedothoracis]
MLIGFSLEIFTYILRTTIRMVNQAKIKVAVDTSYQGLQKVHTQTMLPKKKGKKQPLTKEDKNGNTALAKERVLVENVIGMLKRFKIISDSYRNRKKRFRLRFSLLAGLYNYEFKI